MEDTFQFQTLSEFHEFCNLPKPDHPLISLIDYSKVKFLPNEAELKWIQKFYSIGLKRNVSARFKYGQQQYDFDSGVLCFISPDQFLKLEINLDIEVNATGWLMLIHPDFLWNSPLSTKIQSYDFFRYAVNEALFLSEKEENTVVEILKNIEKEYQGNIDKFSQDLIINQLERLLIHAERFYERQFITRKKSNHELVVRFEQILAIHFNQNDLLFKGTPSVTSLAEALNVSPNYLGSVLRIYTQQSTQQHIHSKMIDFAKSRLISTSLSVSEIAYELGFEHAQSFNKLFKSKTNQSPSEFRLSFN